MDKIIKLITIIVALTICSNSYAEQHRSQKAKVIFKYSHPCPSTGRNKGSCPDYIIDHIKPLACGGLDDASNMQWQTKADAKNKDKIERINC